MLSHQETDNKDIMAIRYFEKEISETMSNLFITEYSDVNVLSIYSDLTKNFLGYKVLRKSALENDLWMNSDFNKKIFMDFNPEFSFIPQKFAASVGDVTIGESEIEIEHPQLPGHIHYSTGLLRHHSLQKQDSVYVYKTNDTYSIFVFQGKDCVFANSFDCFNENEMLYFILNALDINNMDQSKTSLYLDYSLLANAQLVDFLMPYFSEYSPLRLEHPEIDNRIPFLHEMLFPNYLLSLCV